jgi:hypothetical protein
MKSYRYHRRSFLAGIGGAVGLYTLLRNLEASAEGVKSPPRLLLMHWPVGTVPYRFIPDGTGKSYVTSPILQPFETAGLREDMIALYGLKHQFNAGSSGGSEGGVVMATTGVDIPGTRENGGEQDDGVAGGPSFDQIFLKNVPELASAHGYVNAIGDARVDSHETSSQCLSYGYETREIESARPGGLITEHVPLMPETSPFALYTKLFSGFVPGSGDAGAMLRALKLRKSVLDSSLRELERLRTLAPASEREKIDLHAEAIRKVELELTNSLEEGGGCQLPAAPDSALFAPTGSKFYYGDPGSEVDESPALETLGKLHLGLLRAAFQCDLVRVATFQWASSVNQVAFKGLYPNEPEVSYRHHPLSHQIGGAPIREDGPPADPQAAKVLEFLANVQTWFNQKTADVLAEFKVTTDAYGGSLLDHTVVPFFTETANATHSRSPLPALLLGGRALGFQGGQFQNFAKEPRHFNDVWLTVAQAFFPDAASVLEPLAAEKFAQDSTKFSGPIEGLWVKPP